MLHARTLDEARRMIERLGYTFNDISAHFDPATGRGYASSWQTLGPAFYCHPACEVHISPHANLF